MSFLRQVRGELRKLVNPITVGLLVVFIAFFWQDLSRTTFLAEDQAGTAVFSHLVQQQQTAATCAPGAAGSAVECHLARMDEVNSRWFATNSVELGRIGKSLGTLPGLLTFASHQFATGMGWLFVALLAAVHVTREESRGTVAASVLDAGRSRYLGAKAVSLLVAAATALAVSVTVPFAIRSTYAVHPTVPVDVRSTGNGPVPTGTRALAPDATWSSWSHAWAAVWHALAVLAFVALVFAVLASLFRRPLPAALAGAGVIAVFFAIAEWWHHGRWGPMGGISRLFGLDRAPFGIVDVRMWDLSARPGDLATQPFGSVVREVRYLHVQPAPDPYTGLVVWMLVAAAGVAVGWRAFTRRSFAG